MFKLRGVEFPIRCINPIRVNGIFAPCGRCRYCKKRLASQWSFRIEQECNGQFVYNSLLTYDDKHLPMFRGKPSLNKQHVSDMLKRFRENVYRKYGVRLRFFCVGEYGGNYHRPHYHIIFFSNKNLHMKDAQGLVNLDTIKEELLHAWQKGFVNISKFKPKKKNDKQDIASKVKETASIGSMARYMTQYMLNGDGNDDYVKENRPFRHMSRGRAIGYSFLEDYTDFIEDCISRNEYRWYIGKSKDGNDMFMQLPRYYIDKIRPEWHKVENKIKFKQMCNDFCDKLLTLTEKEHEKRKQKIREIYIEERNVEIEEYRLRKVHLRNQLASRIFENPLQAE